MIDHIVQMVAGFIALIVGIYNLKKPGEPFQKRRWLAPSMVVTGILLIIISGLLIYFGK